MGVRIGSVSSSTVVAQPATSVETVVLTTGPINLPLDFAQVLIFFFVGLLTGTGTTAVVARLRRGTLVSSTLIGSGDTLTIGAAVSGYINGHYVDSPGAAADVQYSLTLQQTGGATNGTLGDAFLTAMVL